MRQIFYSIVFLSLISCVQRSGQNTKIDNSNTNTSGALRFKIDSLFLRTYDTKGLKLFSKPDNFSIEENEKVYELVKAKMLFYEYANFAIDAIYCKILIVGFPFDFHMDGDLRFVYLATLDKNNTLIDFIQIGRYDMISDTYFLVVSEIAGNGFKRKLHYEYFIDGVTKLKAIEEDYKIDKEGKILKIPVSNNR